MKSSVYLYILLVTMLCNITQAQDCEEPVNVWFNVSNDQTNSNYGQVVAIDMSHGYSSTDGTFIYLVLNDISTGEQVILTFPIGYWVVEDKDEIQKEFESLEEYLENTNGSLIQKNKVGE